MSTCAHCKKKKKNKKALFTQIGVSLQGDVASFLLTDHWKFVCVSASAGGLLFFQCPGGLVVTAMLLCASS